MSVRRVQCKHSPISGQRPFQLLVDLAEFEPEGLSLLDVSFGEIHQWAYLEVAHSFRLRHRNLLHRLHCSVFIF